jgi:pyruvate dehydrogenase kinase 2/3/4
MTLFRGAQFLKYELPIRLAHRVVELANLPHDLSKMPSVMQVKDWYTQSYLELKEFSEVPFGLPKHFSLSEPSTRTYFKPENSDDYRAELDACNKAFVQCIDHIKRRHAPTTQKIATGVLELKEHWKRTNSPLYPGSYNDAGSPILPLPTAIQSFLDNFYMSRIGIRMLIGQHIALSNNDQPKDYVGIICTKTKYSSICITFD